MCCKDFQTLPNCGKCKSDLKMWLIFLFLSITLSTGCNDTTCTEGTSTTENGTQTPTTSELITELTISTAATILTKTTNPNTESTLTSDCGTNACTTITVTTENGAETRSASEIITESSNPTIDNNTTHPSAETGSISEPDSTTKIVWSALTNTDSTTTGDEGSVTTAFFNITSSEQITLDVITEFTTDDFPGDCTDDTTPEVSQSSEAATNTVTATITEIVTITTDPTAEGNITTTEMSQSSETATYIVTATATATITKIVTITTNPTAEGNATTTEMPLSSETSTEIVTETRHPTDDCPSNCTYELTLNPTTTDVSPKSNTTTTENGGSTEAPPTDQANDNIIDIINNRTIDWQAEENYINCIEFLKNLTLTKNDTFDPITRDIEVLNYTSVVKRLPISFDARVSWSHCQHMKNITHQGCCRSDWAISVASTITDRICIHALTKLKPQISAFDLLTCCRKCKKQGHGCVGGYAKTAWKYWSETGVVTGSGYGKIPTISRTCKPYPKIGINNRIAQKCGKYCASGYSVPYKSDRHRGKIVYRLPNHIQTIQNEIMRNGPVQAAFKMSKDFIFYKRGIYKRVLDLDVGYHNVKILGWGVHDGIPYWLGANSWGTDWGEKGFFRFRRGENLDEIESHMIATIPEDVL